MIDCPECKGAGKIATNYRENAKLDKKNIKLSNVWIHNRIPVLAFIAIIYSIVYGSYKIINSDKIINTYNARVTATQSNIPKSGYLIVQYNEANEVQQCWLSPHKYEEVSIVGKGVYIYMNDIKNPGVIPSSVGVTDLSKCISYQFE